MSLSLIRSNSLCCALLHVFIVLYDVLSLDFVGLSFIMAILLNSFRTYDCMSKCVESENANA